MLFAQGHDEELPEPGHDVILEPFILGDGDDVVRVRLKRGIRDLRMIVIKGLALGCENQTGFVQRVATEHAADRIGDDLLDDISRHEFITLGGCILRVCECWITFQRHSFDWYVAWHLVAYAVGISDQLIILDFSLTLLFGNALTTSNIFQNEFNE